MFKLASVRGYVCVPIKAVQTQLNFIEIHSLFIAWKRHKNLSILMNFRTWEFAEWRDKTNSMANWICISLSIYASLLDKGLSSSLQLPIPTLSELLPFVAEDIFICTVTNTQFKHLLWKLIPISIEFHKYHIVKLDFLSFVQKLVAAGVLTVIASLGTRFPPHSIWFHFTIM